MSKRLKIAYLKTERLSYAQIECYVDSDIFAVIARDYSKICVKDELSGRSEKLLTLAKTLQKVKGLCFVPMTTDNFGVVRKSVAVFLSGKLIRLVDATLVDEKGFTSAFGYKTVTFGDVKIGVAVGRDLISDDCLKVFSLTDCDLIINLSGDFYDFSTETLVSALSYLYKIQGQHIQNRVNTLSPYP